MLSAFLLFVCAFRVLRVSLKKGTFCDLGDKKRGDIIVCTSIPYSKNIPVNAALRRSGKKGFSFSLFQFIYLQQLSLGAGQGQKPSNIALKKQLGQQQLRNCKSLDRCWRWPGQKTSTQHQGPATGGLKEMQREREEAERETLLLVYPPGWQIYGFN